MCELSLVKVAHDRRAAEGRAVLDGAASEAAGAVPGTSSPETAAEQVPPGLDSCWVGVAAFSAGTRQVVAGFQPADVIQSACLQAITISSGFQTVTCRW